MRCCRPGVGGWVGGWVDECLFCSASSSLTLPPLSNPPKPPIRSSSFEPPRPSLPSQPPTHPPTSPGILMILPQSTAYRTLSERLATVSTHNNMLLSSAAASGVRLSPTHPPTHLSIQPASSSSYHPPTHPPKPTQRMPSSSKSSSSSSQQKKEQEEIASLLQTFVAVQAKHTQARREAGQRKSLLGGGKGGGGGGGE